jgi:hypothetical protein
MMHVRSPNLCNIENHTLVPKVGNETSDEDVWNASSMKTKMTRMQVMRNIFFSLASAYQKKHVCVNYDIRNDV